VGRYEEALEIIYASQAHAAAKGEFYYAPDLHRIEGDLLLARDPGSFMAAEAAYEKALEIARRAEGRGWELRTLVSLARLRLAQGRGEEGREGLRPVYQSFDQGRDLPDLREARELLNE
jgi:predicted ATPase